LSETALGTDGEFGITIILHAFIISVYVSQGVAGIVLGAIKDVEELIVAFGA
jgi:hypothetical protein